MRSKHVCGFNTFLRPTSKRIYNIPQQWMRLPKELANNRIAHSWSIYTHALPHYMLLWSWSSAVENNINDYIDSLDLFCSNIASSINDAIAICHRLRKGSVMTKADLKNAFRLCPVRLEDWHLLVIHWENEFDIFPLAYAQPCWPS